MNRLNSELRAQAIGLGLCDQWQNDWKKDCSQEELIRMYKRGLDFCLEHDWPSNEYIKRMFDPDILKANSVFVDVVLEEVHPGSDVVVLQGSCTGTVVWDDREAATVFVRHDCDITLICRGHAIVFLRVYDNAKVKVIQEGMGAVKIRTYGADCHVETVRED